MSLSPGTLRVTASVNRLDRVWSVVGTLERRVTLAVSALLVVVIGGMFWLSHSRVIEAVSSSEMPRLQASADQVSQTLTGQARRLITDAERVAALPELGEALRAPSPTAIAAAAG